MIILVYRKEARWVQTRSACTLDFFRPSAVNLFITFLMWGDGNTKITAVPEGFALS